MAVGPAGARRGSTSRDLASGGSAAGRLGRLAASCDSSVSVTRVIVGPHRHGGRQPATLDSSHRESPEPRPAALRPGSRVRRRCGAHRREPGATRARALRLAMDADPTMEQRTTRPACATCCATPSCSPNVSRSASRRTTPAVPVNTGSGPRPLPPPPRSDGRHGRPVRRPPDRADRASSPPARSPPAGAASMRPSRSTAGIDASPATPESATPSCS